MTSLISTGKVNLTINILFSSFSLQVFFFLFSFFDHQVSVSSCSPGEVVLVLWSDEHTNYQVVFVADLMLVLSLLLLWLNI